MKWTPAGLTSQLLDFARAVEKQFAPLYPQNPPRFPPIAAADLTAAHAARNPYGIAINSDTNQVVVSVLVAGAWTWRKYDGTAL